MSDGQLFKPEKDFTKEVDKQIPEAQELAKVRSDYQLSVQLSPLTIYRATCKPRWKSLLSLRNRHDKYVKSFRISRFNN